MAKSPCVYILAKHPNGALYIGVTSDVVRRVWEHKEGLGGEHTRRYGIKQLVWYELHDSMEEAILREKRLKHWRRDWKVDLIQERNPLWRDLYEEVAGSA